MKLITDILPEATNLGMQKWKYKDWIICLPCGFVKNEVTKQTKRFIRGSDGLQKVLNEIK